jgi:hypothetical protein
MLSFGLIERSPAPRPGAVSGKKGTRRRYCTGFPASLLSVSHLGLGTSQAGSSLWLIQHRLSRPTSVGSTADFNKRLRRSMVRKRFATWRSGETSRREAMKP